MSISCWTHTGGAQRHNYPQVRYSRGDEASYALCKVFAAPYILESPDETQFLRQYGSKMVKILLFEGEGARFDGFSIDKAPLESCRPITF